MLYIINYICLNKMIFLGSHPLVKNTCHCYMKRKLVYSITDQKKTIPLLEFSNTISFNDSSKEN